MNAGGKCLLGQTVLQTMLRRHARAEAGRRIWALGGIPEEPQSLQKLAFLNTGEIYFERWAQGFDGQMHLVQSRRIATVTQEYPHA